MADQQPANRRETLVSLAKAVVSLDKLIVPSLGGPRSILGKDPILVGGFHTRLRADEDSGREGSNFEDQRIRQAEEVLLFFFSA